MAILSLLAALACVALMGLSIQRGATCTVAAVTELIDARRASRLVAMGEAALWVGGGLMLASLSPTLHAILAPPGAVVPGPALFVGAVLLGVGAFVNRACVFGAIARLGSGEWTQALVPAGFFAGSLAAIGLGPPARVAAGAAGLPGAGLLALLFVGFAAWRLVALLRGRVAPAHAATLAIGVTFLLAWALAGRWAYTDWLLDLARGEPVMTPVRLLLFAALLAGAVAGGWRQRRRGERVTLRAALRSLAGGALMGAGSVLIPGSNDGLLLVGLPLLQPHAWLALATMVAAIAACVVLSRRLRRARPAAAS